MHARCGTQSQLTMGPDAPDQRRPLMWINRWHLATLVTMLSLSAGVSYCLVQKPLTLHDGLDPIVKAQQTDSVRELFWDQLHTRAYFRPFRVVQSKLLYDSFSHDLFGAFVGFHVLLTVASVLLLVTLLSPRSGAGFAAATVGGVTFFGLHTSNVLFLEAYPINHFLEIVCLLILTLIATARWRGWFADGTAVLAVLVALGTLESGILVWFALGVAWVLGWRGVSRSGLVTSTALVFAYFGLRLYLDVGTPGLDERSSGFGFQFLDPSVLIDRFEANPWPFYTYNVATSWLSVLFAEPRAGVWALSERLVHGIVPPWMWVNLATSTITSAMVVWFSIRRFGHWIHGRFEDADRFVVIFWAMLAANGTLSYAYTKDVILSPAGILYACAVFAVVREALGCVRTRSGIVAGALAGLCLIVSIGWSVRTVGLLHALRYQAYRQANDWAFIHEVLQDSEVEADPNTRNLVLRLRGVMIRKDVPSPYFVENRTLSPWLDTYR